MKKRNEYPHTEKSCIKAHLAQKEFKDIEVAAPGFLNIYFHEYFWNKYLRDIIKLNIKYGSNKETRR